MAGVQLLCAWVGNLSTVEAVISIHFAITNLQIILFTLYHVIHTGNYLYWGRTITAIGSCCFCYRIDVPLLSDQFDASLVILRRRFCWSYLDLFYKKYEVTHSASLKLSEKAEEKLLSQQANLGEKLLYDRMNTTWWSSAELKQDDFWEEVLFFYSIGMQNQQTLSNRK